MSYSELGLPLNGRNAETVHAGPALNDGVWGKIQHIFSEMYADYVRVFDEGGPQAWLLL